MPALHWNTDSKDNRPGSSRHLNHKGVHDGGEIEQRTEHGQEVNP
jgi:hypothetical protein